MISRTAPLSSERTAEASLSPQVAPPTSAVRGRARTPWLLAAMALAAVTASSTWYLLHAGRESTDDAQVEGHVVVVSARVTGQVLRVRVQDNQLVNEGDVLLELDPADYAAKLEVARADMAASRALADGARVAIAVTQKTAPSTLVQAKGGIATAAAAITSAQAAITEARAALASAESRKSLAELNLKRTSALVTEGALSQAELDSKQTEFDQAQGQYEQSLSRVASAEAALGGASGGLAVARGRLGAADTTNEQLASAQAALALAEARAQQAEAAFKLTELNLSYATVRAPRRGIVSRRSVEAGQTVGPERALLAIVPLDDVWVVGNFKEDQLAELHAGEPATVRLDTYGRREFRGHVDSLASGTGARFALLPPDNATGNFVKVVQRVPVLIRLDEATGVDLRPGMSAEVTVLTRER